MYNLQFSGKYVITLFVFFVLFRFSLISQNNALVLDGAYITMNGGTKTNPIYLVVDQPSTSGIVRTGNGGHINSENQWNIVLWKSATGTGNYVYPFGIAANAADYIPFTFNKTTAGSSDIALSTWATNQQNMPHPDTSNLPAVNYMDCQHMNAAGDSVTAVIDRFWDIKASAATTADLTFTYLGTENTTTNPTGNFYAEHWNGSTWDYPVGPGNAGVTTATGTVGAVMAQTTFSPWTLVKNAPPPILVNGNTTICSGQSTTLSASGGTSYSWIPTGQTVSSITVNPSAGTTYTVIGITASGCAKDTSISINVNPSPVILISGNTSICNGQNATLTASGGNTYSWNPGGQTTSSIVVNPPSNITYTITAANANGCSKDTTISITVFPLPTPAISGNTSLCTGGSTTLTASGGNTYLWNTGATTTSITTTTAGTYSVIVTNANGCTATATAAVVVSSTPIATANNATICSGDVATLSASGGGNYLWNTGETTASINVNTSGTYSVIVSIGSCSDTASATLSVNPSPVITTSGNVTITSGQSTTLSASGGGTYSWSPSTDLSCSACPNPVATPNATTTYTLIVTDVNGCTDISTVTVFVEIICGNLFIPNAFSPNKDGKNDILYVRGNCIKEMNLVIYNRWGEKVFESNDQTKGWDGTFRGNKENTGVFVYVLNGKTTSGENIFKKGNISLIR